MIAGLQQEQLAGAIEALLFVSDEPLTVAVLAEQLEEKPASVTAALRDLAAQYEARNGGILLREVAGGWRLFSAPAYHEVIEAYVMSWDARRLTQASLETLAIVAYNQPVTRAGINSIRGVNSDSSLNGLLEKGLVCEAGALDAPGNPMTYRTTRMFLEKFGLKSVEDLPDVLSFAPDEETKVLIRQRLGGAPEPKAEDVMDSGLFATVEKIDFDQLVFEADDDE